MKRTILLAVVATLMGSGAWAGSQVPVSRKLHNISQYARDQKSVIVRFRSREAMERLKRRVPSRLRKTYRRFPMMATRLSGKEAAELAGNPDVLSVEPDIALRLHDWRFYHRLPYKLQKGRTLGITAGPDDSWGVEPAHEYQPYGLAMMGVTEEFHSKGYRGRGVKVGIIDTGIDTTHPDLHVTGGRNFYAIDSVMFGDVLGHGTHVAGIVGGRQNGYGVVGMAPEAEIYSLRAFDIFGHGDLSAILDCIQWAIDYDLDILNMSFGSSVYSVAMKDALERAHQAGILLVASSGNSGGSNSVAYPAKLDFVVAVGAVDEQGVVADFSSSGPEVEVAAPGVDVLSTFTFPPHYEHFYDRLSGTSMACPHVVGLAALIKSANPGISSHEIRRRLTTFATDLGPAGRDRDYGFGLPLTEREGSADQYQPTAVAGGPYRGVVNEPIVFSTEGTLDRDDNFLSYFWDFGDGTSGRGRSPRHRYAAPGSYTAILTVTDQNGRSGESTAEVEISAGLDQLVHLEAAEVGYVSESRTSMGSSVVAGVRSSRYHYYGVMRFDTPRSQDIRMQSAELVLTCTSRSPKDEGTITAGLLPAAVTRDWSNIDYPAVDQGVAVNLESPIVMSYLHNHVKEGAEHRFRIPQSRLDAFQAQFSEGRVAFRIKLQSSLSYNMLSWQEPRLVVRYLAEVSSGNMAPVARAGYDRRALAGTRVVLDGSGSTDREGTELTYKWSQISGTPVQLQGSAGSSPVAMFTVPEYVDDVLTFELAVSDGVHRAIDTVRVYLNDTPADLHETVLVPGVGKAGYVNDEDPDLNFFTKRVMLSGVLSRWKTRETTTLHGQSVHVGGLQFNLDAVPPGSQIVSAYLELTGIKNRPDNRTAYDIQVLTSDVDAHWSDLDYPGLTGAEVVSTVDTLGPYELDEGKVNRIRVDAALLEQRRNSTGKVTFRIDGPTRLWGSTWEWFGWWSGNEGQTADMGPRLVVTYGALQAVEVPTPSENLPPIIELVSVPRSGLPGEVYDVTFSVTDPDGDQVSLQIDWGDGQSDSLSSFSSGTTHTQSHRWAEPGDYDVTIQAVDQGGAPASARFSVQIRWVTENLPPELPGLRGPQAGTVGVAHDFEVSARDPEGGPVWFAVDWGDGTPVAESPLVESGESFTLTHTWQEPGTYIVSVTAWDGEGAGSQPAQQAVAVQAPPGEELVISGSPTGMWYLGSSYARYRQAQSFRAIGATITAAKLPLIKVGDPAAPVRVSITRSLSSFPLATAQIDPSAVTSSDPDNPSWATAYFDPAVEVTDGYGYYLRVEASPDSENYYRIGFDSTDPYPYGFWYPTVSSTGARRDLDMAAVITFGP